MNLLYGLAIFIVCLVGFFGHPQAAFLLPILQQLMSNGAAASKFSEVQEPEVIIVAPTRELINQIYLEARKFAYGYKLALDI